MTETTEIPTEQRVTCTVTDGIADVRLVRADKMNALDDAMFDAIIETGKKLKNDPTVRVVVISGEGRSFCAGLDASRLSGMGDGTAQAREMGGFEPIGPAKAKGQQAAYVWIDLPVPVIAAVHGYALGGGLQIALGADIRIATPDAKLSVMETKWGLIPDMIGTTILPDLVGRDVAKELTYTARVISGEEADRIGMVTRLSDDPRKAALELAAEINTRSPHAVRLAKELLESSGRVSVAEQLDAEQVAIKALIGSPNQRESVAAGMAKRAPKFADVE